MLDFGVTRLIKRVTFLTIIVFLMFISGVVGYTLADNGECLTEVHDGDSL